MKLRFDVENIKGSGCVHTIEIHLRDHPNIQMIKVDVATGTVTIETDNKAIHDDVALRLKKMGYPEKGSVDGIESMKAKASSLVSCAMGKIGRSKDE